MTGWLVVACFVGYGGSLRMTGWLVVASFVGYGGSLRMTGWLVFASLVGEGGSWGDMWRGEAGEVQHLHLSSRATAE